MNPLITIQIFLDNFFESERHRLLNLVPVALGVGICLYFNMDREPPPWLGLVGLSLSVVLLLGYIVFTKHKTWNGSAASEENRENAENLDIEESFRYPRYLANCVIYGLLFVSLGFLISQIRTINVNTFMLSEEIKDPITFVATVDSCEKTERGLKFLVSNAGRKYNDAANAICQKLNKVHLIWIGEKARKSSEEYVPGVRVLFRAVLSPIGAQAFPEAYDFRKQQYFKGVSARGFVVKPPKILFQCPQATIKMYIEQIRYKINVIIDSCLKNKDVAAIAKALTTGSIGGITKNIREEFSNSGIAHVLAISGLHIGIIGFFIFFIFRLLLCCIPVVSRFIDVKKVAAVLSWFAVLVYLQISGCSVSSVRAFIMYSVVVVAILLNRTAFTMRSVALAATVIMLSTPEVIMFPSFQMSFGAVIAIISYVESSWSAPRFLRWFWEVIITTVVASVPTAIVSIAVFNQLTLNSILANIVCIPLMTFFVMPLLMLGMLLMVFGIADGVIGVAGSGIEVLIKIAETAAKLPGSHFVMHTPNDAAFGVVVASFLLFTLIQHGVRRVGLVGMACGMAMYATQPLPDVFVAPGAKAVGIRTPGDVTCFSHKGYFRAMGESWSRSVGAERRENFRSKTCNKWVKWREGKRAWEADIRGCKVMIRKSGELGKTTKEGLISNLEIVLGEEQNEAAEVIYIRPKRARREGVRRKGRRWE